MEPESVLQTSRKRERMTKTRIDRSGYGRPGRIGVALFGRVPSAETFKQYCAKCHGEDGKGW
jgi:hypothetical protein